MSIEAIESRPTWAANETAGGLSASTIPQAADTPPHDTLAGPCCWGYGTQQYSMGYGHGFAQGYAAAQVDAQAHAEQVRVARSAEDHRAVHAARQRSAARWSA